MENKKILIIEDDEDISIINSIYLKSKGHETLEKSTISEARNVFSEYSPDVILLDVNLPDGSGIDFCSEIRTFSDVPIIFLTCFDDENIKNKGIEAGGNDYLTKPYSLAELGERIDNVNKR